LLKYDYNLKSNFLFEYISKCYFCDAEISESLVQSSVTWSFRNHSNMRLKTHFLLSH